MIKEVVRFLISLFPSNKHQKIVESPKLCCYIRRTSEWPEAEDACSPRHGQYFRAPESLPRRGRFAASLSVGAAMPIGNVKWFDSKKGFGFIINPEGKDVFVHFTSIEGDGFRSLKDGERVDYEQIQGEKGLLAQHVKRLQAAAIRSGQSPAQPA